MLVAVLALVAVAGAVAGTVRGLAGPPAVHGDRPGDVLLVPGKTVTPTHFAQTPSNGTITGGSRGRFGGVDKRGSHPSSGDLLAV